MKKLVGYITASLPNNSFTVDLAFALKESGVDILELGVPFSDPVADGPVIEKANLKALNNGFKLKDLFEISSKIGHDIDTLWMGYMNPFFHYGVENFLKKAQEYGVNGTIIPDLPYEMAQKFEPLFEKYEKTNITFIAPTDSEDRVKLLVENSKKFIYMVAYTGITGSGQKEDLSLLINNVRKYTNTPLYIGFGVDEKSCKEKAVGVDGVIVGSAFVKHLIDDSLSNSEKIKKISLVAKEIKEKINE
ncbi:tryptophan synthase, alpha subunit [Aliarcobacter butzleri 7h1h]|uniref:Tryptophan synthase alpha chain n=1 Tax=Aliarcobacter butzleri L352 TaxID=1447260 RepID=A0A837JBK1_9BACT|nr:tryptophan synthase subunit alpha [Aliarcobacter butzleri]AGR77987.1 tryptophan synthase, alpha subunit [Aliarcobacter butzleri 7h1h]KLE04480.1 tryptophan synthase susbunit alpha [Aliarcobacter butzleri L352]MCG3676772.1 tryptophan synthase subunit alpha [Aliarcobacter butzleri]MCG3706475.1 tryptophan synthase subunit alpha [Aliarcobacter butzleri]MCT7564236.1 tryptophan synthase subunit alpha [Aliarcobacter butzleri]